MKIFNLILAVLLCVACGNTKKIATPVTDNKVETSVSKDSVPENKQKVIEEVEVITTNPTTSLEEPKNTASVTKDSTIIAKEAFNHSVWNELLRNHVSDLGRVDYHAFRKNRGILREYIQSLGAQMPKEAWTKEDRLAYWMNAYNAMTVDLILRNMPLNSIKDIDQPWKQRLWKLGSKWYNLDEIEHQILRKMKDPRIHFGINCASFSCPPLANEAFTASQVNEQLDTLASAFINNTKHNTITEDRIEISKIFTWFAKDFKQDGTVIDYLNRYSTIKINSKAKKIYKDYNWNLNN